jgi:hypothetical protein
MSDENREAKMIPNTVDPIELVKVFPREAENLRVCLIGESGSGKTARVKQLASELNYPLVIRLLATELPEEFLGVPTRDGDTLRWSYPEWVWELHHHPGILFLDELDKARPENLATTLTLLWDKRVHKVSLHPDTIIVAAMQPVSPEIWLSDETGIALSGRLVFVHARPRLPQNIVIPEGYLPASEIELPVARRVNARALNWVMDNVRRFTREQLWTTLLGIFPRDLAEDMFLQMKAQIQLTPKDFLEVVKRENLWDSISVPEYAIAATAAITAEDTADDLMTVIDKIWRNHPKKEDRQTILRSWWENVSKILDENGGEIEVMRNETEESFIKKSTAVVDGLIRDAENGTLWANAKRPRRTRKNVSEAES